MRLGCRLSYSALPSRRNSGENSSRLQPNASAARSVYPTGTVDLMTTSAPGLTLPTSESTASTVEVLKICRSGS